MYPLTLTLAPHGVCALLTPAHLLSLHGKWGNDKSGDCLRGVVLPTHSEMPY